MNSKKEDAFVSKKEAEAILDIDQLLPFQTLNIDINNIGQKPLDHYFKFFCQKEKDILTARFEDLLTNYVTTSYSAKEQNQLEVHVRASALADFEAEIATLEKDLRTGHRPLQFSFPAFVELTKRRDLPVPTGSSTKRQQEMISALKKFENDVVLLSCALQASGDSETSKERLKSVPINVVRHFAKNEGIKFDQMVSKESLLKQLKAINNFKPQMGSFGGQTGAFRAL
jgi:hypothetical protein